MMLAFDTYLYTDLRLPQTMPNSVLSAIQNEIYEYIHPCIKSGAPEEFSVEREKFIDILKSKIPIMSFIKGSEYIACDQYVRIATRLIFKKEMKKQHWDLGISCEDRRKKENLIFNIAFSSIMSGIRRDFHIKIEEKVVAKKLEFCIKILTNR